MTCVDIPTWIQSWNWSSFVPDLIVAFFTGLFLALVVFYLERRASRKAASAIVDASWEAALPQLARDLPKRIGIQRRHADAFIHSFSSLPLVEWAANTKNRDVQAASAGKDMAHRMLTAIDNTERILRDHCSVEQEQTQIGVLDKAATGRNIGAVRDILQNPNHDPLQDLTRWGAIFADAELEKYLRMPAPDWVNKMRSIAEHPEVKKAWKTQVAIENRFATIYDQVQAAAAKSVDPTASA